MSELNRAQVVQILKEYFAGKSTVAGLYLYGSFAEDSPRPYSDVDVGVLYVPRQTPGPWEQFRMAQELSEHLHGRKVDLVDLHRVSPILRMQVLRKGMLLLVQNRRVLDEFFMHTSTAYADLKRTRHPIEQSLGRVSIYG